MDKFIAFFECNLHYVMLPTVSLNGRMLSIQFTYVTDEVLIVTVSLTGRMLSIYPFHVTIYSPITIRFTYPRGLLEAKHTV